MKRIIIVGSSGFVGKSLNNFLSKKNYKIINFSRSNKRDILKIKKLPKSDYIIYCIKTNDIKKSLYLFRHFKNLLNTNVFGNGFKRFNKQLKMIVVREYSFNLRHHIHCIIEQPIRYTDLEFNFLIHKLWNKTYFGYSEIHIEKPTSHKRKVGWFNYIMKDNVENSIDWNNTVL